MLQLRIHQSEHYCQQSGAGLVLQGMRQGGEMLLSSEPAIS